MGNFTPTRLGFTAVSLLVIFLLVASGSIFILTVTGTIDRLIKELIPSNPAPTAATLSPAIQQATTSTTPKKRLPTSALVKPPPQKNPPASAVPTLINQLPESESAYAINYYTLQYQDNILVPSAGIDTSKRETIESLFRKIGVSSKFANKLTVIISPRQKGITDTATVNLSQGETIVLPIPSTGGEDGFANARGNYILLHESISGDYLSSVTVHEVGHLVSELLTPDEFKSFMQQRKMDQAMVNSWYDYLQMEKLGKQTDMPINISPWEKSPEEDFAESFKSSFGSGSDQENWTIKTTYGPLSPEQLAWMKSIIGPKFQQ